MLGPWEAELGATAAALDDCRQEYVQGLRRVLEQLGERLLGAKVGVRCWRGWAEERDLAGVLRDSREGDRKAGYTRAGPHRADLLLEIRSHGPRWTASRGEQKLLGAALVLAQCELAADRVGRIALLVDEPAAELDRAHLDCLLGTIADVRAQVFLASITTEGLPLTRGGAMFHVEHGSPKALL
jgi:DNA replication and repair protein RecF